MQPTLRRAATASPAGRMPEAPVLIMDEHDWAQAELASYFKQHPERLSVQLDRIMDKLRESQGDMQGFIMELDGMIDKLNADIDRERSGMAGRERQMRNYPDITNEFLHFFLDGIMEAMEKEQEGGGPPAAGPTRPLRASISSLPSAGTGSGSGAAMPGAMRPRSSGSSGSSRERFTGVAKRMQT